MCIRDSNYSVYTFFQITDAYNYFPIPDSEMSVNKACLLYTSNGVIIITTKQGKVGKPQLSYDGSFGISTVTKKLDRCV